MTNFDIEKIKGDFPILSREINGSKLVYLDNAATSQKPNAVIDAISKFYTLHNANVHRGVHTLSEESTDLYEASRKKVATFINAAFSDEIVFTSGTTASINMIAASWGDTAISEGDVILVTGAEHHSNFVPWQMLAKKKKAKLIVVPVQESIAGWISAFKDLLSQHQQQVKMVAIFHASNVLGTILPVKEIVSEAHKYGAKVCVDGAQAVPHLKVNVQNLDCDFYTFSGHKMLAPMGIGVLWIKKELIKDLVPSVFGGGMIDQVSPEQTTWAESPEKYEAGTPNVEGAVGLAVAIDYLENIGMEAVRSHELFLTEYAINSLSQIEDLVLVGSKTAQDRTGLVSFYLKNVHSHDVASVLNNDGIAVRSGHHCAMPLHHSLGIPSTVRASFYIYNTTDEIDKLVAAIKKAIKILG